MLDQYHDAAQKAFMDASSFSAIGPNDSAVSGWHKDADALIIRSETKITASDLERAPRLRLIVKQGAGVDNIDLKAAKAHDVAVYNTPGVNSETVAEMALTLGLVLARRVLDYDRAIRAGEKIVRSKMLGIGLFGKTVGIIGMGNIGKIGARKWIGAVNANIIAYDPVLPKDAWLDIPHTRAESVEDVLRQADVVTLHVPLLPTTHHMIGEKQLALMRPNSILLNTARGGLVDEAALVQAVRAGKLFGAALDVQEIEPPSRDAHAELLESGKIILTPHVGGSTEECQMLMGTTAVDSLVRLLAGETDVPGRCA